MNPYLKAFNVLPFPCLLLEKSEEGFVVIDVNNSYCQESGKKREELIGSSCPSFSDAESIFDSNLQENVTSIQEVFATGHLTVTIIKPAQLTFQKGEKEERFWEVQCIPIKDDAGQVVQVLVLAMEKPDKVREELTGNEELAKQLEKQQHFIEQNRDGLYSLDAEGNFTSLNEGLSKLAEVPQEELLHTSFLPFCAPHEKERTFKHFSEALEGKRQVFEAEFISAGGKNLVLEISLVPIKVEGKISGVYGIAKDYTPLREKEKELFRSQKKFQAMIQEGSDLVAILGSDGVYKFVSENSENVLGLKAAYFIGKNAFDFIHPEDKERVLNDFSVLEEEKQVRIKPFRFKDGTGNWRWIETQATNLIEDPYVDGIVTNSREITELIEQSQQIKQLYERYTLAAEATEDLIYDWNLVTDEVIRFHKSSDKLFGYTRKEIDERDFWRSHIHPEDLPHLREQLKDNLQDKAQQNIKTQYRFERADGSYAQIIDRANIIRNEKGEAVRLIGATSDVSELVNNKHALKLANKRFSYAMKATKEMIWDWDIEKGHIKRSTSFNKIFGYSTPRSSSVFKFWFEKIADGDRERIRGSLYTALNDPGVKKWREEYSFVKSNGEKAFVIDRGYILRDRQGKAIRMVGAVLDVTESRRMLQEIKNQNKVLREVAWEQAHIVRAPLARLKGLLDLLEEESFEQWTREELVRLIRHSAEEIDNVIGKIIRKTEKVGSE